MLRLNETVEITALLNAADHLCVAARTAPKGKGKDLLVTAVVTDEDKGKLQTRMRLIGERDNIAFFLRDADNLEQSPVIVLLGTRKVPLGIPACGYCGFENCAAMAADFRIDNRIMYSAGKAAVELGMLGKGIEIAYGIPLAAKGKNPFFDRG